MLLFTASHRLRLHPHRSAATFSHQIHVLFYDVFVGSQKESRQLCFGDRGREESLATLRCDKGPALRPAPVLAADSATVAMGFFEASVPSSAVMLPSSAREISDLSHWIRCSKASTGPRPSKLFSKEPQQQMAPIFCDSPHQSSETGKTIANHMAYRVLVAAC
jgi:hypothetical protein